jgi:hypothetical protein
MIGFSSGYTRIKFKKKKNKWEKEYKDFTIFLRKKMAIFENVLFEQEPE